MPLSRESYELMKKYLPKEVLAQFGTPTFPKTATSISLSQEARANLSRAAQAFKYNSISALIEAIGLGVLWIDIPSMEERELRENTPENYPYIIEIPVK